MRDYDLTEEKAARNYVLYCLDEKQNPTTYYQTDKLASLLSSGFKNR